MYYVFNEHIINRWAEIFLVDTVHYITCTSYMLLSESADRKLKVLSLRKEKKNSQISIYTVCVPMLCDCML